MWGTMYVPYRKAYLSGMNPLSFVTMFTVGELLTMLVLTWTLDGGRRSSAFQLLHSRQGALLDLPGRLCLGDRRHVPAVRREVPGGSAAGSRSRTPTSLWGLAWGALVFGELAGSDHRHKLMVLYGLGDHDRGCQSPSARRRPLPRRTRRAMWCSSASAIATAWTIARCCWAQSGEETRRAHGTAAVVGLSHRSGGDRGLCLAGERGRRCLRWR